MKAIRTWHVPALEVLNNLFNEKQENLRANGRDVKNAAVHKDEFRTALCQHYALHLSYVQEIERSMVKDGQIIYLGQNYLIPKNGGVL